MNRHISQFHNNHRVITFSVFTATKLYFRCDIFPCSFTSICNVSLGYQHLGQFMSSIDIKGIPLSTGIPYVQLYLQMPAEVMTGEN